jgi:hypothetical protein
MFPLFAGKTHHFPHDFLAFSVVTSFPGLAFGGRADDHSARVRLLIGLEVTKVAVWTLVNGWVLPWV